MKKVSILSQIVLMSIVLSCKHTDQNLIHNIQQEVTLQSQSATEFDGLQKKIFEVLSTANQASPEDMQNPLFQEVVKQASIIEAKAKVSQEEFLGNSTKLEDLIASYSEGKINKEEAEKQYAALKTDADAVKKLLVTLNNMIDSTQAKWAKVMPK